jgi:catechol 2,3-dioxygenase
VHDTVAGPRSERVPPTLRLGAVALTVTDLERSLCFYERTIGLRLHRRDGGRAALGSGGEDVIVLVEEPAARPAGRHAGLYHVALLHPSRQELARAALRLMATRTAVYGASDHGTHEAIYLPDPDGNELELAADRPREAWPELRVVDGGPAPLDVADLLSVVAGEEPPAVAGPGLAVGHVHFHVGALDQALAFYRDTLGFELRLRLPTAAFMSVNGYHHHVAVNTWRGEEVPPVPPGTVRLRHWTIVLDGADEVAAAAARVRSRGFPLEERGGEVLARDPWDIPVLLTARSRP